MTKRLKILLTGRVQGVGLRPYIYRLASELALTGFVFNDTHGVTIELQGPSEKLATFNDWLSSRRQAPPLLKIASMQITELPVIPGESRFVIQTSDSKGPVSSEVAPDCALCPDCLRELFDPADFRYHYPFITCTNCGPRYSIVKTIPYDRPNTTMSGFDMCSRCSSQYADPADRRFHAQPVACPLCGPKITLLDNSGIAVETGSDSVITRCVELLLSGRIVAIKGIGGFHLAVDALSESAVTLLRSRKQREHKPFAIMAAYVDDISRFARVDSDTAQLLTSPQTPIVLLPKIEPSPIAPSVAAGTNTFGFMLPYAPLHHLLFASRSGSRRLEALVMTSANISDEPLICDNTEALEKLSSIADFFLVHDRDIYRQVDDSVVQVIDDTPVLLRRSRGYVPAPVLHSQRTPVDILALGSDLKNTFCLAKAGQFIMSEHIGDLENPSVYRHWIKSIAHFSKLFELEPKLVAADLHPLYLSTQYAQSLGLELIQVQHHWAHAASVLAEYDFPGPVIALSADGTGYGTDGAIWGCECLVATLDDFTRFGHLEYYPLPGADRASKEPLRPLAGLLKTAYPDADYNDFLPVLSKIEPDPAKIALVFEQLDKKINLAQASSLGRLFDAAAALIGLGSYNHFEAQLPMALEAIADPNTTDSYDFTLRQASPSALLSFSPMLGQILQDLKSGISPSVISALFHNTIARGLADLASLAREHTGISTVALSGGVFCNRYLSAQLITLLKQINFCVLLNRYAPINDGGISLGQAAIAARKAVLKRF